MGTLACRGVTPQQVATDALHERGGETNATLQVIRDAGTLTVVEITSKPARRAVDLRTARAQTIPATVRNRGTGGNPSSPAIARGFLFQQQGNGQWQPSIGLARDLMGDLTAKQEAFCLFVFQGDSNSDAYRKAYDVGENTKPETIWNDAYKMRKHPEVSARIEELRAQAAEIGMVTVHSITEELDQARKKAIALDQPHNMIKATTEKAKLHGLTPDRLEVTGKDGGPIETADITDKEVARRLAFLLERGMRSDISES